MKHISNHSTARQRKARPSPKSLRLRQLINYVATAIVTLIIGAGSSLLADLIKWLLQHP